MKFQILLATLCAGTAFGSTVVSFSDSADVITGPPPSLDTTAYTNTVIGNGGWQVLANPYHSTISNLAITHYILLIGSGTLDTVTVHGEASGTVTLTANAGSPREQTFSAQNGSLANEYVFDMAGYDMHQGGETLISGFNSMDRIDFSGTYTSVPEPATSFLLAASTACLAWRRNRCRGKQTT